MQQNQKISEFTCGQIMAYIDQGLSTRQVAARMNLKKSSVAYVVRRYKLHGITTRMPGSGRRSSLDAAEKRILLETWHKNPKLSAPKIQQFSRNENILSVSTQTIRNCFSDLEIFSRSICNKPLLSAKNVASRLRLATEWSTRPETFWKKVIFSDECKFNLFNADGNAKVWRPDGERLNSKFMRPTVKHGGGSVMVWCCMSYFGVGELVFIDTTMDRMHYANILSNSLTPSATQMGLGEYIFQHNNDPKHASAHVRSFLANSGVQVLEWPSQSPDLNPIENLFAYMKDRLRGSMIKNKLELKAKILEAWNSIPAHVCKKLVESMYKRCCCVIKAKGWHIDY